MDVARVLGEYSSIVPECPEYPSTVHIYEDDAGVTVDNGNSKNTYSRSEFTANGKLHHKGCTGVFDGKTIRWYREDELLLVYTKVETSDQPMELQEDLKRVKNQYEAVLDTLLAPLALSSLHSARSPFAWLNHLLWRHLTPFI